MSTKRPQDLFRDLGPGTDEPLEHIWKTNKVKFEGSTSKSFKEIINELTIIKGKDKKNELRYNDRNVELLVQAGRLAPSSEFYPHPEIEALFSHKGELEITSDCVAAWAGGSAWGVRTKQDKIIRKNIIIGVYGGKITNKRGIYVLDATVEGDATRWVDGDPDHGDISMFGRMNEDIHGGNINMEIDVSGIIYTTEKIGGKTELLTTYGESYNWDHVIEIGLRRLGTDLAQFFSGLVVDIPINMKGLKATNPLHNWIKKLVLGEALLDEFHSTVEPQMGMDLDSLISYITSSVAHNKYAFRSCGGNNHTTEIVTRETIGRDHVNYCVKRIPKALCTVPFSRVMKLNDRISTLRRAVLNGGLITEKILAPLMVHDNSDPIGPALDSLGGSATLTPREESLVKRIIGKFPWTEEQLKDVTSLTLRLGDDPIRMALVDVLDGRLLGNQLHSCKEGRDWRLVDGLAATLRSGELYVEFNGDTCSVAGKDKVKGRNIPLSRWCDGHVISSNIMTLVRVNSSVKELAVAIRLRNGCRTMSNPLVGVESITITKGRVKIELDLGNGAERKRLLDDINSVSWRKRMDKEIMGLPIWKVSVFHKTGGQ